MAKNIVILTGAGISAESGIKTFRDHNGLWENHRIEEVASPEGFQQNPALVYNFYNLRRKQLLEDTLKPNAAHYALAELEKEWKGDFLLVTQNVDNLHERAGSKKLLHMHGELQKAQCMNCQTPSLWIKDLDHSSTCPLCHAKKLRPHIVWFGEMPLYMDEIYLALEWADIFISIGTSGQVYPAAGFVMATPKECFKIEINNQETNISTSFDQHFVGPAATEVPKLKDFLKALL